ncbi:MAG: CPBP family intramembrane metalloprotease [Proteobacteria bacterium]|nr:CPBP family intramembrane metalloprotease [Pseudomonadota bacterium]
MKPSIKILIFYVLLYLFAVVPLTVALFYGLDFVGYNVKRLATNLSEIIIAIQIGITCALSLALMRKHFDFLFGKRLQKDYLRFIKVGMRWTVPLLVLHIMAFLIPNIRENLIHRYSSIKMISITDATNVALILFVILLSMAAIFEEMIFRGILIQKLLQITNKTVSIFVSAGLFSLSHLIYSSISLDTLISSFFVGVLCGFAYISTGSCLAAFIPHLFNNLMCVGFIWMLRYSGVN